MKSFIILVFLFLHISVTAQVSSAEKRLIESIDKNNEEARALIRQIVNVNSGTMNFAGVKMVGSILSKKLSALGLETRWIDGSPFNRSGHLMAWNNGKGSGPKLLLIGHLDTVFELSSPFQKYTMLNDSTMQGPGVADMKGGDVIIFSALQALKETGLLDHMRVKAIFMGDEEWSGGPLKLARKDLIEAATWADIALGFENGDGNPKTIVVSRRGSAKWDLKVKGTPAHSSQIFTEKVGVGAIFETARILNSFYMQLSPEEILTFNPGVIIGGTSVEYHDSLSGGSAFGKRNVVARETIVKGDLRAISPQQLEKVKSTMSEIVGNNLKGTSAEITFGISSYPPLAPSTGNLKLLELYNIVSQDLGFGLVTAVNPRDAGAADISFTSGLVDMAVDGLGLSGADDHTVHETGDISKLSVQAKRAAVLMYRLSRRTN